MKKQGWYDDMISSQLPRIFEKILKKDISDLLVVRSLENGNLIITVNSSVWKFELIQRRSQIIDEINKELEEYSIKSITFL